MTYQVIAHCHVTNLVKPHIVGSWSPKLHNAGQTSRMLYPCLIEGRIEKLVLLRKQKIFAVGDPYLKESQ